MKKIILSLLGLIIALPVYAQTIRQLDKWNLTGTILTPRTSTWGLQVPLLGSSGNPCLTVNSVGTFSTTTCLSSTGAITSLNGLTTSTQLFTTSTALNQFNIISSGNTHTFTLPSNIGFFANDSSYLTSSIFPIPVASTSLAITTPLILATNNLSMPTSTGLVDGFLKSADWTTFNNKQNLISFPIPVASTSLTASTPIILSTNNISFGGVFATSGLSGIQISSSSGIWTWNQATSTALQSGFLSATDFAIFNNKYSRSINSISASTTAGSASVTDYVYFVTGTSTIILPTAVGNTNFYRIKNIGTSTVSILATSSQTIDGDASINLSVQFTSVDLISNGSNWYVF